MTSRLRKIDSAGYLANHMARLFALGLGEALEPLGMTTAQFAVLLELWERDAVTQRELVDALDLEQATVANTLARMVRDGLVVRRPHPTDLRAQTIHLTEAARRVEADATAAARRVNEELLAGLDAAERRALVGLMRRVIDARREAREPDRAPAPRPSRPAPRPGRGRAR